MAEMHSDDLTALFAAYREALPDPEPSAGFMPQMWSAIEARKRRNRGIRLLARRFLTLGGALATGLALLVLYVGPQSSSLYSATYVEVLDDEQAVEAGEMDAPESL